MRLSRIKLAGFKSFVDPTTLHLPSNLVGIVGPNGCGKSNTIDAVRWVMGESSARYLRGESMEDVIFTGSSTRKPVGQAGVELIFDNSDGTVGGEYAAYNEISVKRQVSREGQSQYFLNGRRCRRRDITDIFLGTGLGPRSYAIIEQGMISRVIEAKPEELRVYLEEAAGISKYKERRRETENRIRHARENLDRLNDLREEVDKQLERLARQSRVAERFKLLKSDERRLRAELLGLRFVEQRDELAGRAQKLGELETALQRAVAEQRRAEAEIERQRAAHTSANEAFNQVQARFYQVGAEISRHEQAIAHARQNRQRQDEEWRQLDKAWREASEHIEQDRARLAELAASIEGDTPEQARLAQGQQAAGDQLASAERAMADWQQQWEQCSRERNEPVQRAQVERSRIEQFERQLTQAEQRLSRLQSDARELDTGTLEVQIEERILDEVDAAEAVELAQAQLDEQREQLAEQRENQRELQSRLDSQRSDLQRQQGRLASLEALQQAALGESDSAAQQWLAEQGLGDAVRLAQQLRVRAGWESAVEAVLAARLEAVCVATLERAAAIDQLVGAQLTLLESADAESSVKPDSLLGLIECDSNWRGALADWLAGVRTADSLEKALATRSELASGECFVTPAGELVGAHWLRSRPVQSAQGSVIAREAELVALCESLSDLQAQVAVLAEQLDATSAALHATERERDSAQQRLSQAQREHTEQRAALAQARRQLEQQRERGARVASERAELQEQIELAREDLLLAQERRDEALEQAELMSARVDSLESRRGELREQLDTARALAQQHRDAEREVAVRLASLASARSATEENLARMQAQLDHVSQRREQLKLALAESQAPDEMLREQLAELLESRVEIEQALADARDAVAELEAQLREQEQLRLRHEREAEQQRATLEQARLDAQGVRVRLQTLTEQIIEAGHQPEVLVAELPDEAEIDDWAKQLAEIERQIARLGPINLAAIDEYKEQQERKSYLDSQHEDISSALETLEGAIAKIDRETRSRFKETFDTVSGKVQAFFPRLFGGGHASLVLTGDDLLSTGVSIMARPPGKKVSNIHLLSGGEKALTAVALVFALFELNPAPFCMLDEVDAPLDDANVGRFCDMVREMSERVQFIFITHNKATMELSEQLMGVTMHEPGVSRLVSVDVQEAVRLAQQN
jgi:chromosome segregation protein